MGELWRSESMKLVQLFIPLEAARDTIDELGELGLVQFRDLNANVNLFQRSFVNDVKRADEMERILRFFQDQVAKEKEAGADFDDIQLSTEHEDETKDVEKYDIDQLEAYFEDLEKELNQLNANKDKLTRNFNELIELEHVLTKDANFFKTEHTENEGDRVVDGESESESEAPLLSDDEGKKNEGESVFPKTIRLGFVTGVIHRDKFNSFQRILWRATRGNLFMKYEEIDEPIEDPNDPGKLVEKNVFIIFYQGNRAQNKIKKICESYGAHLYPCPDSAAERRELIKKVDRRIEELEKVNQRSVDHRQRVISHIASHLETWRAKIIKEKAIYHTMNMFNYDVGRKCLIGDGWCPEAGIERVREALLRSNRKSGSSVDSILHIIETKEEPPTYYKTNKLTQAFQAIVDSYGVARYQEVNPAPLTIITFPFLFAIMFGDMGHGFLLLIFAAYLVLKEKELMAGKLDEMVQTCFDGRYVLLLMGLFSMYTGSLYNEVFSVPTDVFGSKWERNGGDPQYRWTFPDTVYPWGVDPAWKYRKNELIYYNSLKMKISIIFGVSQMTVGIILSGWNAIYFKKPLNLIFEFIPQMVFMMSIFGYMCLLILWKWSTDYSDDVSEAPSLINMIINMFLKPYDPVPSGSGKAMFSGQIIVQGILIFLAIVSVPLMLLPKPLILRAQHKKKSKREGLSAPVEDEDDEDEEEKEEPKDSEKQRLTGGKKKKTKKSSSSDSESDEESHATGGSGGHGGGHGGHGEEFDFGEVFVHQIIHTIEFVLGCVSNTASYLRLWALSLAHSELAWVFWSYVLVEIGLASKNFFLIWVCFAVWAGCTFGVLLVMESLSAFLHALRLHWVEFQNKFYQGDGYAFQPFSYERLLKADEDAD